MFIQIKVYYNGYLFFYIFSGIVYDFFFNIGNEEITSLKNLCFSFGRIRVGESVSKTRNLVDEVL